ncbi:MAG TPA: phytanoyl-CoA dioxygenase family protein [Alphaproteobacteria bacterium]|nr:phytanoyl-CoA dioxygenase family protein [Alphaproteobacteria bacterium]
MPDTAPAFADPLPNVPWVESPFFERLLAARAPDPLLAERARFFRENGYLVVDFELPDFDAVTAGILEALEGRYVDGIRLQDAWRIHEGVRRIAAHPPMLDLLAGLYGRAPIPFQTLNFKVGTEQPLHSDAAHFSSVPERFMCGVWVAFEDMDEGNGPLEYVPGSHRLPIWGYDALGFTGSEDSRRGERERYNALWSALPEALGLRRERFTVRRGQALIWAANLLHGGSPRLDRTRTRHSQVTHYYFEDCAYYTPLRSDPFLGRIAFRDIVDVRTGAPVPNRYNGAALPPAVAEALDPASGVNPVGGRPPRLQRLLRAAAEPRGGAQWRIEEEPASLFLHPNPGGAETAAVAFSGLLFEGRSRFEATLELRHPEARPVRFAVALRAPGAAEPVHAESRVLAAGERLGWMVDLPAVRGPHELVLSTEMEPDPAFGGLVVRRRNVNAHAFFHDPALRHG